LSNVLNINKNVEYLVVCRASLLEYLLALRPDLVVAGKWTVLSVKPCSDVIFLPTHFLAIVFQYCRVFAVPEAGGDRMGVHLPSQAHSTATAAAARA
jgi:hypothetical protein